MNFSQTVMNARAESDGPDLVGAIRTMRMLTFFGSDGRIAFVEDLTVQHVKERILRAARKRGYNAVRIPFLRISKQSADEHLSIILDQLNEAGFAPALFNIEYDEGSGIGTLDVGIFTETEVECLS